MYVYLLFSGGGATNVSNTSPHFLQLFPIQSPFKGSHIVSWCLQNNRLMHFNITTTSNHHKKNPPTKLIRAYKLSLAYNSYLDTYRSHSNAFS